MGAVVYWQSWSFRTYHIWLTKSSRAESSGLCVCICVCERCFSLCPSEVKNSSLGSKVVNEENACYCRSVRGKKQWTVIKIGITDRHRKQSSMKWTVADSVKMTVMCSGSCFQDMQKNWLQFLSFMKNFINRFITDYLTTFLYTRTETHRNSPVGKWV